MVKKYLPLILLIAAAFLFLWVKKNQRGPVEHIPVNAEVPLPGNNTATPEIGSFDRSITTIVYSKHARCRMDCRHIDESEVKEILKSGVINTARIEEDAKGKTYPLEGITHDKQHVRIVFAAHEKKLVVVTVIDLEKEWACNCY